MNEVLNNSEISNELLHEMFDIISCNMSKLYNQEITDEDYLVWSKNILDNDRMKTIIIRDNELCGYLQYIDYDNEKKTLICEIEIAESHQGDRVTFKQLLSRFVDEHNDDDYIVYGKINKNNNHSREVFEHIGLKNTENNIYSISLLELKEYIKKTRAI